MNYLTLEQISRAYGDKVLFQNVNLRLNKGDKVALVAKNGSGKSTLLRIIAGKEPPEGQGAKVWIHPDIKLGYLPQEPQFDGAHTVLDAVLRSNHPAIAALYEYEKGLLLGADAPTMEGLLARMDDLQAWDAEARMKEVLFRLKVTQLDQTLDTLSGGQLKRLALARLLIEEPELLVLDEPTNHLDLDMVEWLETFLSQSNRTLFMVTHDRYFLESVCNTIVELDGGKLYKYAGNYSEFLAKKAMRHETEAAELDKTRKLYQRELEWVRRMPKARGTKAKARMERFHQLAEQATRKIARQEIQIDVKGARLGGKILECHHISKAYGTLKIVDQFTYKFRKGEKVGIVGPNGVGKTTFLRLLMGLEKPDSGKVVAGGTVQFGYFTQQGIQLDEDKRVIDVVTDIAEYIPLERGKKLTAAQLLERFLFDRKHQQVYVSQLSGGEKRRLHLLTVLMRNPNFLILDELTNDLDILTLNVLEDWLMRFTGCVVVVSHDRYFLDKLVDHLFVFEGHGRIRDFNGSYTTYRAQQKVAMCTSSTAGSTATTARTQKKAKQVHGGLTFEERKAMSRLEKKIGKLEQQRTQLHQAFAQSDLAPEQIGELAQQLKEVEVQIEQLEEQWFALAEKTNQ